MLSDLVRSLVSPDEIYSMLKLKYSLNTQPTGVLSLQSIATMDSYEFCYALLNKVSRSFAMVIQELPEELRHPVCLFYLVLRGLDTVEDDMAYPLEKKLKLLVEFDDKLYEDGFKLTDCGSGDYKVLLEYFYHVVKEFKSLKRPYQETIKDICHKMGVGMAEFCQRKVVTLADYNLYCHYVAGLVGIGLSRLFSDSQLEEKELASQETLSNSMGLFLQKTNIIRDYLEDVNDGRIFWPDEVWKRYAEKIEDFRDRSDSQSRLGCLNWLIHDALSHVPDCLEYLAKLKDPKVFRFCAIPQVMAFATLALLYRNENVFMKVVKIRRGLSAKLMTSITDMNSVNNWFHHFALEVEKLIPPKDEDLQTFQLVQKIKQLTSTSQFVSSTFLTPKKTFGLVAAAGVVAAGLVYAY